MAKDKKKKTPSRVKYEQSHPTVSFRITKELHDRLQAVRKAKGRSLADVLKVGVGLLEVKVSSEKEASEQRATDKRLERAEGWSRKQSDRLLGMMGRSYPFQVASQWRNKRPKTCNQGKRASEV